MKSEKDGVELVVSILVSIITALLERIIPLMTLPNKSTTL